MTVRPKRKRDVVGKDELARKTRPRLKQMMKVSNSMLDVFVYRTYARKKKLKEVVGAVVACSCKMRIQRRL